MILNVRQQLDLQVLNNMLAVFSFLSEIPDEFRRKDKPVLIIRIKDFQNFDLLEENPKFLDEYLEKWLAKGDDQFDHVKEAFKMSFNIKIIATEIPTFTNKKHATIDINDENFQKQNPTFTEACYLIIEQSTTQSPNILMRDPQKLNYLVKSLIENKNIDHKKLDLYHNITSLELERYVNQKINIEPHNDTSIKNTMDGSVTSYNYYMQRKQMLDELHDATYNIKFKDYPDDLKNQIFDPWFDKYKNFIGECKYINMDKAMKLIAPHINKFNSKYDGPFSFDLVNAITSIFSDKKQMLMIELNKIDLNVKNDLMKQIDDEFIQLTEAQKEIERLNSEQEKLIQELIVKHDINESLKKLTRHIIDNMTNFNEPIRVTFAGVVCKIELALKKIHVDNDKLYHLDKNKRITSSPQMKYNIDSLIPSLNDFEKLYWEMKNKKLTDMIIIKGVTYNANPGINFVSIDLFQDIVFEMTENSYELIYKNVVKKLEQYTVFRDQIEAPLIIEGPNQKRLNIRIPNSWTWKESEGRQLVIRRVKSVFIDNLLFHIGKLNPESICL